MAGLLNPRQRAIQNPGSSPVISQNLLQPSQKAALPLLSPDPLLGEQRAVISNTPLRRGVQSTTVDVEEGIVLPEGTLQERFESGEFISSPDAPVDEGRQFINEAQNRASQLGEEERAQLEAARESEMQAAIDAAKNEVVRTNASEGEITLGEVGEEAGLIEEFAGKFDLFTLGAMLLATNDGKRGIGQNLGSALIEARKAKVGQAATARKAKTQDLADKKTMAETQKLLAEARKENDRTLAGMGIKMSDLKPNDTDIKSASQVIAAASGMKPDSKTSMKLAPELAANINRIRATAFVQGKQVSEQMIHKKALQILQKENPTLLKDISGFFGDDDKLQQRLGQ